MPLSKTGKYIGWSYKYTKKLNGEVARFDRGFKNIDRLAGSFPDISIEIVVDRQIAFSGLGTGGKNIQLSVFAIGNTLERGSVDGIHVLMEARAMLQGSLTTPLNSHPTAHRVFSAKCKTKKETPQK